ncbi:MAG: helix-turn-helix domain-containing protein [Streptosporangiaceae bacterium]
MVHEREWQARIAAEIGQRIAAYRHERRLTAQQLADLCGLPGLTRVVITRLENGRRESVSTAELQVIARALNVPAVLLLFPLGHAATVEVVPGEHVDPWAAIQWFGGQSEDPADPAAAPQMGLYSPLVLWAEHLRCDGEIPVLQRHLSDNPEFYERQLGITVSSLRRVREVMQHSGLKPPRLTPETALILERTPPDGQHR